MRTEVSYQGRKGLAICWDDVSGILTSTPAVVREALKSSGMGANHISRDFVPKNSSNFIIKRGTNSHSQKCSVVWVDKLPEDLAYKAKQGVIYILILCIT